MMPFGGLRDTIMVMFLPSIFEGASTITLSPSVSCTWFSKSLRRLCALRVSAVSFSQLGFTAEAQRAHQS